MKLESGDSGGTKSVVETVYESCACSPLGKVKKVSQPYAPGGTVYWTVYTYDARGRTTRIDHPGNTGATTYVYSGNTILLAVTGVIGRRTQTGKLYFPQPPNTPGWGHLIYGQ